ncbi:MAG: sigma 54-interacting transcriptional regulator [candidate division Zixibacteria bacterium]|nr:sigma 54-interacting transcriptional regulator [candidate division Zixibacteria bacterium]
MDSELRNKFAQLAPAFLVAIEKDGKIRMMNEAMLHATGYKSVEVIGQDYLSKFVHRDEHQILSEVFEKIVKSTQTFNENNILTKDGRRILVEWHGRHIMDKNGELEYFFGVGLDITDRKRAEEALKTALTEVEKLKKQLEQENLYLQDEIKVSSNFEEIIGRSSALNKVLGKVEKVATTNSTVLILGETGTGKELIARAIYNISGCSDHPLVKVNCAALPANIIESELFGHEKGAFTGAYIRKIGRFELADRGTIFLDEIGDLAIELQVKLLRVLQDGEFERLGNSKTIKVNVRIIAATNRDLEKALAKGTFREDLYYRLNVFPIIVPSLRDRKEDIPLLVNHFVKKYCNKIGRKIDIIPQTLMDRLLTYHWPGNIRELENIIERAVVVCQGNRLEAGDWLPQKTIPAVDVDTTTLEEVEKAHILKVLESTRWKVSGDKGAAKILGLNPNTLVSKMKKLKINH